MKKSVHDTVTSLEALIDRVGAIENDEDFKKRLKEYKMLKEQLGEQLEELGIENQTIVSTKYMLNTSVVDFQVLSQDAVIAHVGAVTFKTLFRDSKRRYMRFIDRKAVTKALAKKKVA